MAKKSGKKNKGKLIIFTAPSGAGKTTIVQHLLRTYNDLDFSVSATNRKKRPKEIEGKNYYFLSTKEFKEKIKTGAFMEWEEVYDDQFYGTLHSEMNRIWKTGKHIVFDIDVRGAVNIKKAYPKNSLAVFIKPPSKNVLFERLKNRKTEDKKSLEKRIRRAEKELTYENKFDYILVNDVLEVALKEAELIVEDFLGIKENALKQK